MFSPEVRNQRWRSLGMGASRYDMFPYQQPLTGDFRGVAAGADRVLVVSGWTSEMN